MAVSVLEIADRLEPRLRREFLSAFTELQDRANVSEMLRQLEIGNMAGALRALKSAEIETSLARLAAIVERGFLVAGAAAAEEVLAARSIRAAEAVIEAFTQQWTISGTAAIRFDLVNPLAASAARQHGARLVREISAETRAAITVAVQRSFGEGVAPRELARLIRPLIGLNAKQVQAVVNARTAWIASGLNVETAEVKAQRYAAKLLRQRALTIARTESIRAAASGQLEAWKSAAREGILQPWRTVRVWDASTDSRVCPLCSRLDGERVAFDAPFSFGGMAPPRHPQCLPEDSLVAACGRIAAVSQRTYDGDLLVIHTALGKTLAVTPNHPILTPSGWRQAHVLDVGSHVVGSRFRQWELRQFHVDDQHMPARFHQIAEAARRAEHMRAAPVPLAPEDFHGDGRGSEVAVIWTDRLLRNRLNAESAEHLSKCSLCGRAVRSCDLTSLSDLAPMLKSLFATARGIVCRRDLRRPPLGIHRGPLQKFSGASAARRDPTLAQPVTNSAAIDTELACQLLHGYAGLVAPDKVIAVNNLRFHGPVYNMETSSGAYWANGILTHNCRCSMVLSEAGEAA
jgi:hypothetical protein